jgi:hypothetical protein
MVTEAREVERKFELDVDGPLPSLVDEGGAMTVTDPIETELEAPYFDTADLVWRVAG